MVDVGVTARNTEEVINNVVWPLNLRGVKVKKKSNSQNEEIWNYCNWLVHYESVV